MTTWAETLGETFETKPHRDQVREHYLVRQVFDELRYGLRERSPQTTEPTRTRAVSDGYVVEGAALGVYVVGSAAFRQIFSRNLSGLDRVGGITEGFTSDDEKPMYTVVGSSMSSSPVNAVVVRAIHAETDTGGITALPELGTKALHLWRAEASLARLFELARDERFEDGMDSNLSVGLRVLLRDYGVDFTLVLEEQLKKRQVSPRIVAEVLHTLGTINGEATKDWRLSTLVYFLQSSPSPTVRDAAAVGLAYLEDKRALPYLHEAIERESSETFREDLQAVVDQLSA